MPAIMLYIVIFIAKLTEVSLSTVRNVLINRGEKLLAAIIGFFEVLIWIIVVSNVLASIAHDPIKVIVYCLAFACGNYLGIMIEGKLALGTACIQVMVTEEMEAQAGQADLKKLLHDKGFGVTTVPAHGIDREVDLMMIYLTRKRVNEAIELIRANTPSALVTVGDVRQMRGGYLKK